MLLQRVFVKAKYSTHLRQQCGPVEIEFQSGWVQTERFHVGVNGHRKVWIRRVVASGLNGMNFVNYVCVLNIQVFKLIKFDGVKIHEKNDWNSLKTALKLVHKNLHLWSHPEALTNPSKLGFWRKTNFCSHHLLQNPGYAAEVTES